MLAPVCAALALVLSAAAPARTARAPSTPARTSASASATKAAAPKSELERARALLADVKRDPAKRRYRHRWERAIAALEKAAKGADRPAALLEAARARYALYRFSQVDADRAAALALAARARRAGAKDAAAFAAAVRREMGEEEPPSPPARPPAKRERPSKESGPSEIAAAKPPARDAARPGPSATRPSAVPTAPATEDQEPPTDSILEKVLRETAEAQAAEAPDDGTPARISDLRSWSNGEYTRVAVYLSRRVPFTREEIPAEGGRPRRLAIDFKPARLAHGLARDVGDAMVARVRAAQRDADTVRVVLDLAGQEDLDLFALDDPPRLIVDVGTVQDRREAPAAPQVQAQPPAPAQPPPQPPAPPSREEAGEFTARRALRRIIVDAGHGGHDTGAIGPTGVREKDVTLALARKLSRRLEARGFDVILTRREDRSVALEERTAIANARRGDLFISLHANAHPRRDRRGVETYVLNMADDRYAARLAARENGALRDAGSDILDVRRILAQLDARSSLDASRQLAQSVQRELCSGIRARVGDVRDLGVKSALFHVLLGARMPAVLVETSFISNRIEEKRLDSPRFQDEVADDITRAVLQFAGSQARIASIR